MSGSIQHIRKQALALWAEAACALAVLLPGVLVLQKQRALTHFILMHFSTEGVLLSFWLTKYHFNSSKGHYFMSGKMLSDYDGLLCEHK